MGASLKSWFQNNSDAVAARAFLNVEAGGIFALVYLGSIQSSIMPDEVACELWLGPDGERIFHFHREDDLRYSTYAGGNPRDRKGPDPGRAYLFLRTHNIPWNKLAIRSFAAYFRKAERYAGNFALSGQHPDIAGLLSPANKIPADDLALLHDVVEGRPSIKETIEVGFEERFLAKLALGLGFNLFSYPFLEKSYAVQLRNMLWARDPSEGVEIRGTGYFSERDDIMDPMVSYRGAYVLLMQDLGDTFALSVYTPGGRGLHVSIADQPELWQDACYDTYRTGLVFIVVPQLSRFIGGVSLPNYLAHKRGGFRHHELAAIESYSRSSTPTAE
jgi:hypothetical protein